LWGVIGRQPVFEFQANRLASQPPFKAVPILVRGDVKVEGRKVLLGNLRLMEREKVSLNGLGDKVTELQNQAKTAMWVAVDGEAAAVISAR